jgi:hypothetical protein
MLFFSIYPNLESFRFIISRKKSFNRANPRFNMSNLFDKNLLSLGGTIEKHFLFVNESLVLKRKGRRCAWGRNAEGMPVLFKSGF